MTVFVLLDILLLILIALFVPIGFWRGAQREVLVTLGILLGAALADAWASSWGAALADLTRLRESGGAFMVAVLWLIGSTFLLGYGAGAALPVPRPSMFSRLFGALIAGANGALLLSYALRDIRIYLLPQENAGFLDQAMVARFLSGGAGWLLLGGVLLAVPLVVGLALLGRGEVVADYGEADETFETGYSLSPRRFPPRMPAVADDDTTVAYKTEPPTVAPRRPTDETRPIRFQFAPGMAENWGGQARSDPPSDHAVIARGSPPPDAQQTVQIGAPATNHADATVRDGRCPACHADVRAAEVFCPSCGRVL